MGYVTSIVILVCFIALLTIPVVAAIRFRRHSSKLTHEILERSIPPEVQKVLEIEHLPEPVKRWLKFSGAVGRIVPRTVWLRQRGHFRRNKSDGWSPFDAEQVYSTSPPAFLWSVNMRVSRWLRITGRDIYDGARGRMLIKLWSLISVANAKGSEIDQGAQMRFLNEIMWFPQAAVLPCIRWEPVDHFHARATMTDSGRSVSAEFEFDEDGKLVTMTAPRYMSRGNTFSLETWSTPILEYGEMNGLRIPIRGKGVWSLSEGDFAYIHLEVTEIRYEG